jgi:hypothetical protein
MYLGNEIPESMEYSTATVADGFDQLQHFRRGNPT